MSAHAALVGRARPLGLGALVGAAALFACGRIELGSYMDRGGSAASGTPGAAGNGASDGRADGAPSVLMGTPDSVLTPGENDAAGGAPVGVFGASEGGSPDVDSTTVEPPELGLDAGRDAGDASVSIELGRQSAVRRPSRRLDRRCGGDAEPARCPP